MSLEQLAVAKDRKDKLLSRVHKKRIELDFRDRSPHSDNAIHCCRHCAGLFSEKVGSRRCCREPTSFVFLGQGLSVLPSLFGSHPAQWRSATRCQCSRAHPQHHCRSRLFFGISSSPPAKFTAVLLQEPGSVFFDA